MDTQRRKQFEKIVALSEQMLAFAKDGLWDRVAELEIVRREQVGGCFQSGTSSQDAFEVKAAINAILTINREITRLGEQRRDDIGANISNNNFGRAASRAYQGITR